VPPSDRSRHEKINEVILSLKKPPYFLCFGKLPHILTIFQDNLSETISGYPPIISVDIFSGLFYIPRRIADMTAKLTVTNSSRTHEYAIVRMERTGGSVSLKATTIEIPPGGYELGFKDVDAGIFRRSASRFT